MKGKNTNELTDNGFDAVKGKEDCGTSFFPHLNKFNYLNGAKEIYSLPPLLRSLAIFSFQ